MNRNTSIDFVKGVAIILMVVGHAGPAVLVGKFIYLFHMAVFFMAAGYFFSPAKVSDWRGLRNFTLRRFKKLWGTYVFWSVILILCHNLFISLNIYTDNPEFETLGLGGWNHITPYWHTSRKFAGSIFWSLFMMTSPNGAFWFLKALLVSSVIYAVCSYVITKVTRREMIAQSVLALALLVCGRYLPDSMIFHYLGGRVVLTAYALLHLGRVLGKVTIGGAMTIGLSFVGLASLLLFLRFDRFELALNVYPSIPVLIGASVAGWYFLCGMSFLFVKCKIQTAIVAVGRKSLTILIFHFLSFKIVSAIGVIVLGYPLYCIAAFPTFFKGSLWCLAYAATGVLVPLALDGIYTLVSKKIRELWLVR